MITPAEIQKKAFTKGVRGYKEDEVDSFLDLITLDMDKLMQENNVLNEKTHTLNAEIERYRNSENAIFDTLESAKALMADISSSAEKRAEIVLRNAELDADRVHREARESVERITEEAVEMVRRWEQFKTRYKSLLQNELERFENLSKDFMPEGDAHRLRFYSDTLPGAPSRKDDAGPSAQPAVGSGDFDASKTINQQKRNGR
ncbi:MAG: DivIVA domain-containing protein [Clostridiales Family XIII bacterium]|jgi:cell division initiation protein|nr:DivIVA domain-containing protein [Clostridiales Family XIII bacterium]